MLWSAFLIDTFKHISSKCKAYIYCCCRVYLTNQSNLILVVKKRKKLLLFDLAGTFKDRKLSDQIRAYGFFYK
jgi:hypothetical protein